MNTENQDWRCLTCGYAWSKPTMFACPRCGARGDEGKVVLQSLVPSGKAIVRGWLRAAILLIVGLAGVVWAGKCALAEGHIVAREIGGLK